MMLSVLLVIMSALIGVPAWAMADKSLSSPAVSEMMAMMFFSSWEIEAFTLPKNARLSYPNRSFIFAIPSPGGNPCFRPEPVRWH